VPEDVGEQRDEQPEEGRSLERADRPADRQRERGDGNENEHYEICSGNVHSKRHEDPRESDGDGEDKQ